MKINYLFRLGVLLVACSLFFGGCKRDKDDEPQPHDSSFNVRLAFHVDQVPLSFSQMIYQNEAGNSYQVEKLQFYISAFEFERSDGSKVISDEIIFVDVKEGKNINFKLEKIPQGVYTSAKFLVGLDSAHNISNSLPATIDNVNMAWPVGMGGGYHFLKFEGSYNDGSAVFGFAMHIGRNQFVVHAGVSKNMNIASAAEPLQLRMNLNEWFKNPHVYDFDIDGNYSMGSMPAMTKLSQNGVDIFYE